MNNLKTTALKTLTLRAASHWVVNLPSPPPIKPTTMSVGRSTRRHLDLFATWPFSVRLRTDNSTAYASPTLVSPSHVCLTYLFRYFCPLFKYLFTCLFVFVFISISYRDWMFSTTWSCCIINGGRHSLVGGVLGSVSCLIRCGSDPPLGRFFSR